MVSCLTDPLIFGILHGKALKSRWKSAALTENLNLLNFSDATYSNQPALLMKLFINILLPFLVVNLVMKW